MLNEVDLNLNWKVVACEKWSEMFETFKNLNPFYGNSVIPVNGDESVDLENTQLYKKVSRSSLTYVKTIL